MKQNARKILWLDSGAAAIVGVLVVALREWLAGVYGLSPELVLFMGVSNLAYASYSGLLAARAGGGRRPSRRAIEVLVIANACWLVVCSAVIGMTWKTASVLVLAQIAVEGIFCGALAVTEWRVVRPSGG